MTRIPECRSGEDPAGARKIALDDDTLEVLCAWRTAQKAEYLALGIRPDHGLVFTNEAGRGLWPNRVTIRFGELCDLLELPRIGMHGLRHTAATTSEPESTR